MDYYIKALKKYADFDGRATRSEFWYFVLFNILIAIVLGFVDSLIGTTDIGMMGWGLFSGLYSLAVLVPGLAVGARRLHDVGQSALLLLLGFIPLIGPIVLIVFWVMDSEDGMNQYGPNPKSEVTKTHEQGAAIEQEPPKEPPVTKSTETSRPTPPPIPGEESTNTGVSDREE